MRNPRVIGTTLQIASKTIWQSHRLVGGLLSPLSIVGFLNAGLACNFRSQRPWFDFAEGYCRITCCHSKGTTIGVGTFAQNENDSNHQSSILREVLQVYLSIFLNLAWLGGA